MKDPYMYLQCLTCGNIFRTLKSGAVDYYMGERTYFIYCPHCDMTECKRTTRKAFDESNEVKPD